MANIYSKIIYLFKSRFFQLGSIVLVGSFLVNILNYVFNLVMGRMLSPEEFGEVASLIGLIAIIAVPSSSVIRLMSKYTADFQERGKFNLISDLFRAVGRRIKQAGVFALILFLILIPFFGWYLKIENLPLIIFSLFIPFSLLLSVNQGVLQGLHKFIPFSITSFLSAFFKLSLSILFVYLGFSVSGVMLALIVGYIISYLYSRWQIRPVVKSTTDLNTDEVKEEINRKDIVDYAKAMFWASLLLVLLTNTDIVLAKHYLSSYLAGQYAVLSLTGKIIFYACGAFLTVMFPMVSASIANKDGKEKDLLKMAFVTNGLIAGGILMVFLFFPVLSIKLLFGVKYLSVAPYLLWFSVAMFFSAFSQIFVTYFMAIHAKNYLKPFAFSICLQAVLIALFHNNILQIVLSVLVADLLLFILMLSVYFKNNRLKI